jgi:hypothetical protein
VASVAIVALLPTTFVIVVVVYAVTLVGTTVLVAVEQMQKPTPEVEVW